MYLCTQFGKYNKIRYSTFMVISIKPLRFIIAALVVSLPLISFANSEQDSTKLNSVVALEVTGEAHSEPTDIKSAKGLNKSFSIVERSAGLIKSYTQS